MSGNNCRLIATFSLKTSSPPYANIAASKITSSSIPMKSYDLSRLPESPKSIIPTFKSVVNRILL